MTGISGYINSSLHLARNYARIFVRGHYLFREAHRELQRTDDIVFRDKYPSIFSPQMKAIVLIVLKIFFTTRVLKINYSIIFSNIRSRDVFRPILRERKYWMDCNHEKFVQNHKWNHEPQSGRKGYNPTTSTPDDVDTIRILLRILESNKIAERWPLME